MILSEYVWIVLIWSNWDMHKYALMLYTLLLGAMNYGWSLCFLFFVRPFLSWIPYLALSCSPLCFDDQSFQLLFVSSTKEHMVVYYDFLSLAYLLSGNKMIFTEFKLCFCSLQSSFVSNLKLRVLRFKQALFFAGYCHSYKIKD